MTSALKIDLPDDVSAILQALQAGGHSAHAVGGCVRDALMGKRPHDWDICTSARPDEIKSCLPGVQTVDTGAAYGTVTAILRGGSYEITTYRVDGGYADGRHPDSVRFVSHLLEDLSRRDFTVNAMAYNERDGLIDPFDGAGDIRRRTIRAVGDPDRRFTEDALRILRAMRFCAMLSFAVESSTARSMHAHADWLARVSAERMAAELNRMLVGSGIRQALDAFSDVLAVPIPELRATFGFDQQNPHHDRTLERHIFDAVAYSEPTLTVRLTLLLHDLEKPSCFTLDETGRGHCYGHAVVGAETAERILRRLRYDRNTIDAVKTLVRCHDVDLQPTPHCVRRWLGRLGETRLRQLIAVQRADAAAHRNPVPRLELLTRFSAALDKVLKENPCVSLKTLAVDGNDLIALGVPTGPIMGELLRALLNLVMEDEIPNEREALRAAALRLI